MDSSLFIGRQKKKNTSVMIVLCVHKRALQVWYWTGHLCISVKRLLKTITHLNHNNEDCKDILIFNLKAPFRMLYNLQVKTQLKAIHRR